MAVDLRAGTIETVDLGDEGFDVACMWDVLNIYSTRSAPCATRLPYGNRRPPLVDTRRCRKLFRPSLWKTLAPIQSSGNPPLVFHA